MNVVQWNSTELVYKISARLMRVDPDVVTIMFSYVVFFPFLSLCLSGYFYLQRKNKFQKKMYRLLRTISTIKKNIIKKKIEHVTCLWRNSSLSVTANNNWNISLNLFSVPLMTMRSKKYKYIEKHCDDYMLFRLDCLLDWSRITNYYHKQNRLKGWAAIYMYLSFFWIDYHILRTSMVCLNKYIILIDTTDIFRYDHFICFESENV